MTTCYHIQTHDRPQQVFRLVSMIKEQTPQSYVLVSHKTSGPPLDVRGLESMPDVHVLPATGGLGDFSHVDRYLESVEWLLDHDVDFRWLTNLTGQDYPIRPLPEIEQELATSVVDGFLQHARLLEHGGNTEGICTPRIARDRYLYRHWRFGLPSERKQRLLRPAMIVNHLQPWLRVSTTAASVGLRRRTTPFTEGFELFGGAFYCTLSRDCLVYLRDFARENPDVVRFMRATLNPEEIFFHTVLVNSGRFQFHNGSKRYQDYSGGRHGHSQIFGLDDFDRIVASGDHFARKFDLDAAPEVLDRLDRQVLNRLPN